MCICVYAWVGYDLETRTMGCDLVIRIKKNRKKETGNSRRIGDVPVETKHT